MILSEEAYYISKEWNPCYDGFNQIGSCQSVSAQVSSDKEGIQDADNSRRHDINRCRKQVVYLYNEVNE